MHGQSGTDVPEADGAEQIAQSVLETPGQTIQRMLVIKGNVIRADRFRVLEVVRLEWSEQHTISTWSSIR